MKRKVYRSRVSVFFTLLMLCMFSYIGNLTGDLVLFVVLGVCIIGSFFQFRSLYYVMTDSEIQVYYMWGFMGKPFSRMLISAIISVERTYYPFATAMSLKRLRFRFKKGYKWYRYGYTPVISPVKEQEFLETLKTINPNIQINVNNKKGWWRFWDWDI